MKDEDILKMAQASVAVAELYASAFEKQLDMARKNQHIPEEDEIFVALELTKSMMQTILWANRPMGKESNE